MKIKELLLAVGVYAVAQICTAAPLVAAIMFNPWWLLIEILSCPLSLVFFIGGMDWVEKVLSKTEEKKRLDGNTTQH